MLPILYHTHHSAYPEDLLFWLELAQQYGDPVLELGCGTGRVTVPLSEAGFRVVGLDRDREMLAYLQRTTSAAGARLSVFQANMAEFHLAAQFPLILLPCNTLSSLEEKDRLGVFQQAVAHLASGGVFGVSLPNPILLADMPAKGAEEVEDEFTHPLTGDPVQVSSAWRRTKSHFILTWHYDLLKQDGQVRRYSIQTKHTLQSLESYIQEMQQAGLVVLETWGDFDRSDYEADSPNLLLLVRAEAR